MIKFFRKIRQKLLTENKFGKYILYAVGEILLVVIGIMIALYINNKNLQRITENKIVEILKEIQTDLSEDILKADEMIAYYKLKKSKIKLILDNKLTDADFINNPLSSKFLILTANHIKIHDNGFKNLMINTNNIPKKYKDIVSPLNEIYIYNKYEINKFDEKMNIITDDFETILVTNYDWYYSNSTSITISNDMIEYLSTPSYKNYAYRYAVTGWTLLSSELSKFRYNAVEVYLKITKLIGNEDELPEYIDHNFIEIDPEILEQYTGTYDLMLIENENPSISESKFRISINENVLVYEALDNLGITNHIYFKSMNKGYDKNGFEYEFTRNEDGTVRDFVRTRYFSLITRRINYYKKID